MHGNLKATEGCKYINFSVGKVLKATEGIQFVSIVEDWRGESEKDCLEMAGKKNTEGNLKCLLHFAIIQANKFGQPNGQNLETTEDQVFISSVIDVLYVNDNKN